jgi:hypothetical protein
MSPLTLRRLLQTRPSLLSYSWLSPLKCSTASPWLQRVGRLSVKELDLVDFLVTQVASLSSSLAEVVACEAAITVSRTPPLVGGEVMDLQSNLVVSPPPLGLMRSWMLWLSSSGHRPPLWWPWSFRPLALGSASRQSCLTSLL